MNKMLLALFFLAPLGLGGCNVSHLLHGGGGQGGVHLPCDEYCDDTGCTSYCAEEGDYGCQPDIDQDCDWLLDDFEASCNTNPARIDSDGDGTPDGEEDLDGDGFNNLDEQEAGTNPADASDFPDTNEPGPSHPADPAVTPTDPATTDTDGDGLMDADEAACNTSPSLADTDGDGVLDGDEDPDGDGFSNAEEIAAGTNPADGTDASAGQVTPPAPATTPADPATTDTDGDGLADADEAACNTSPSLADTDGDGVLDGDEDPDSDGYTNAEEIAAGSDPADSSMTPENCGLCVGNCGNVDMGNGDFNGGDVSINCASADSGAQGAAIFLGLIAFLGLPLIRRRRSTTEPS